MRLGWTLTISPGSIGIVLNPLGFAAMLATIEIVRRAQWNLFRLENEQLNNVGRFRAVNVVVPPSDQESVASARSYIQQTLGKLIRLDIGKHNQSEKAIPQPVVTKEGFTELQEMNEERALTSLEEIQ